MLFRLLMLVIYLKKADHNTKIGETEKKIPDQSKYITTSEFNNLTVEHFGKIKRCKISN